MKHNLIPYTTRGLIELRGVLLGTLKNEKCKSLDEPVRGSISQINTALSTVLETAYPTNECPRI